MPVRGGVYLGLGSRLRDMDPSFTHCPNLHIHEGWYCCVKHGEYLDVFNEATTVKIFMTCNVGYNNGKCFIEEKEKKKKKEEEETKIQQEKEEAEKRARIQAKIDKIKAAYIKKLSKNPNDVQIYLNRGIDFLADGFIDLAIEDFSQCIQLEPDNIEGYLNRGLAYMSKAEEYRRKNKKSQNISSNYKKAIQDCDQAQEITSDARLFRIRGTAHFEMKEYDKAIPDFSEAIRLDTTSSVTDYLGRGMAYREVGQDEQAKQDLEKVLTLKPDSDSLARVKKTLNEIYEEERKRKEKHEHYEKLVIDMEKATTIEEYQRLTKEFKNLKGYEDSKELANKCEGQYQILKKQKEKEAQKQRLIILCIIGAAVIIIALLIAFSNKQSKNASASTIPSQNKTATTPKSTSTSSSSTTTQDQEYKVLDIGPAGGYIFYDKGSYSNGWRYLEAAPASKEYRSDWGLVNYNCTGTRTEVGTGRANTQSILQHLITKGETRKAAQLCDALTVNGYSDWFLPSKDELNLMYTVLRVGNNIGGFNTNGHKRDIDSWYFSSSAAGTNNLYTYTQSFIDGDQDRSNDSTNDNNRADNLVVRAIRAF